MWFNNGGAIEFGQAMLKAGQLGKLLRILQTVECVHSYYVLLSIMIIESYFS